MSLISTTALKAWWGAAAKALLLAGGSAILFASVHSQELASHRQIWQNSTLALSAPPYPMVVCMGGGVGLHMSLLAVLQTCPFAF